MWKTYRGLFSDKNHKAWPYHSPSSIRYSNLKIFFHRFFNLKVSDYESEVHSLFKLFAIGGSGSYEWASEDLDVAIVSQEGSIKSKRRGKTVKFISFFYKKKKCLL